MATTKAYALGRLGNKLSVNGTDVDIGGKIKTEISAPAITIDASDVGGKTPVGEELFPNGGLENAIANGWSKNSESSFISNKHGDNTVANILSTDGSFPYIKKTVTLTAGKTYLMQYDLVRYKSGTPRISLSGGGGAKSSPDHTTTLGTKSYSFTAFASDAFDMRVSRNGGDCDFDVDNVSLKEVAPKNTALLKLQGNVATGGDTISSVSISDNDTEFASINTVRGYTNNELVGDTTIATTGELILNGQTGVTIDCNNVTNQSVLNVSNMGAGNTGIVLSSETRIGWITIGSRMDHARTTAIAGTNRSLAFIVNGSYGDGSYAAFDFTIDPNGSSRHPAVMGVRSPNNNALLFQGEQSDSTVVFSVDYDGNVATSGTVDGVDIAARDAVLTSTTTTANDALPKTGGTITGDVTATTVNATTVDLGDWTITEASGSLLFATQGVTKMKLDSSGNLDVVGNINSSAYIYSAAALIVNGKTPPLAFDFVNSYFRNSGNDSTFGNSLTFTRASSATMTSSSGLVVTVANGVNRLGHHIYNSISSSWVNSGILIESEARTNYVQDSHLQDTNNGMGTFITTRAVFTENNYASPDGTTNAAKLAGDGSNNSHKANIYVQGSGTSPGLTDTATFSVYLKQGTHRYAQVEVMDNAADTNGSLNRLFINIDLQTGTILGTLEVGSPTNPNARIENVGNGWYRASATLTKKGDNVRTDGGVMFSNAGAANANPATTSGANDYFYVWGAQLEAGAIASSLIPTAGGVITRAAELLTVAAAKMPSPALYVETTGTELVTNSTFDTASDWTLDAGWSITGGQIIKVSGTGNSKNAYATLSTPLIAGRSYLVTLDVSAVYAVVVGFGSSVNVLGNTFTGLTTGTNTLSFIASGNHTVVAFIGHNAYTITVNSISLKEVDPPTVSIQMSGTMTYVDEGLFASTNHTGAGQATFYRQSAGAVDYIYGGIQTGTVRTGQVKITQRDSGAAGAYMIDGASNDYSPGINVPFKIAARHGATFVNGAVDGTALTANTTPTALPDLSSINLQLGYDYMGTIGKFVVWNEDIGDTGIASASL